MLQPVVLIFKESATSYIIKFRAELICTFIGLVEQPEPKRRVSVCCWYVKTPIAAYRLFRANSEWFVIFIFIFIHNIYLYLCMCIYKQTLSYCVLWKKILFFYYVYYITNYHYGPLMAGTCFVVLCIWVEISDIFGLCNGGHVRDGAYGGCKGRLLIQLYCGVDGAVWR